MKINVSQLTKKYGTQNAVNNISFEVKTGEILGFLGPNGAGKTTTMKILSCYMAASEGDVTIGNIDLNIDQESAKKHIGYLPENNPLYHEMPVLEYLEFLAKLQGVSSSKIKLRVKEMVNLCGLNREKHKKIGELSKGFRQRVGLAQAMIHDPEILILDEPTTGLDPNQIVEIRKLIKELGKEKTVILSTHILPEVEATCDRILIINKGKIVADGTPKELHKEAKNQHLVKVKIESNDANLVMEKLEALEDVENITLSKEDEGALLIESKKGREANKAIFKCCVQNKWIILEMRSIETRLEDIFRDLTVN